MRIENIKLLESFCDSVLKNAKNKKSLNLPTKDKTENSYFELPPNHSLSIVSMEQLCSEHSSMFDKLITSYYDQGDTEMANLLQSISIQIEESDLTEDEKESFRNRFLDFNYPVV